MNFIPIFPLDIVVFPGEKLNLHIFEPRYKQLIRECIEQQKSFGIPSVMNGRVEELGTVMQVTELVKEYDNGEMDIRTVGDKIFRILEIVKEIPDKLYSGAIVTYPDNVMGKGDTRISDLILEEVKRMYALLNVEEKFPHGTTSMVSYQIGHFIGLSRAEEYELYSIFTEVQRLEYIRRHLKKWLPMVEELEKMKARIQLNGHFRDLSLGDFKI